MARVELRGVEKDFGAERVVKGVSLRVEAGEFLVLVGPSGCGKSTCLRMIAGLEDVSAGEVCIGDRVVNHVPPKDRDIGMVFQSYALYPHMTVYENMAFGLKLRKMPKADVAKRITEVAAMLGLSELLARRPKALSGGQRQRVAIGRAIARRPSVFLFDEPLSNLDAALRVQMRSELAQLHQRLDATMIYVTHDQVEAMTLADRIAVLEAGVLQQVGSPLDLYHRPANRFVAGFIGTPSMNFVPGRVEARPGGARFVCAAAPGSEVSLGARTLPDGPATLGVRAQDLALAASGPLSGRVEVIERLGWEAFVHVAALEQRLIVRAEGEQARDVRVSDTVHVALDPERVHVFDAQGVALGEPGAPDAAVAGNA